MRRRNSKCERDEREKEKNKGVLKGQEVKMGHEIESIMWEKEQKMQKREMRGEEQERYEWEVKVGHEIESMKCGRRKNSIC